jgi:hypothetical protein
MTNPIQDRLDKLNRDRTIVIGSDGKPFRHWSGRVQMAKVLRQWVNDHTTLHLNTDEATELAEVAIEAYLKEQL